MEELVSVEEHQEQQLRVLVQKEQGRAHCEQTEQVIQCALSVIARMFAGQTCKSGVNAFPYSKHSHLWQWIPITAW